MNQHCDPVLKETLYTERLQNGLTVVVLQKPGYQCATGYMAVRYGSIDNAFVMSSTGGRICLPDGTAHFLEHTLFERLDENISDRFSELGAESNAYTTYTNTVYHFRTTTNFELCLRLLLDLVQNPVFTAESVAKEQGIIQQEIQMGNDDVVWRSNMELLEALYIHHPIKTDITGTSNSIREITDSILYMCHRIFYHPANMVLFVAGDVSPHKVISIAREFFIGQALPPQEKIQRSIPEEPTVVHERRRVERLVVSQPIFRVGFKSPITGLRGPQLLKHDLLTGILLDLVCDRGSQLYTELYESGLIDLRFESDYVIDETFGYSYFLTPTHDPDKLEERLLSGLEKVCRTGVSEADFERVRKKTLGRLIQSMNSLEFIADAFVEKFFLDIGIFDYIPMIQTLTLHEANEQLITQFAPAHRAISIIYPK